MWQYILDIVEKYIKNNPNPPKIELMKGRRRWDAPIPPRPTELPNAPPQLKCKCHD